jgi:hypothetical protein
LYIKKMALSEGTILLNPITAEKMNMKEGEKARLYLGVWHIEVLLVLDKETDRDVLKIPDNLFGFTIPEDIDFEWRKEGRSLFLGPVLGIVRGVSMANINKRSLRILLRWVTPYKKIKGLVVIFPLSEVQEDSTSIKGFCYHPGQEGAKWMEGTFPMPDAVFNRPIAGVGNKYHLLEKITEGRFFNSRGTGKWEFYQALLKNPDASSLVPYTEKFKNFEQLFSMLEGYQVLYLKKRFGARGYGIIQLKKTPQAIEVTRVIKGTQIKEFYETEEECIDCLQKIVKKNRYIIQQGVPYENKKKQVDFRGYIQKDSGKGWQVRGFIGRLAIPGSVITNLRYTEKILPGKDALKEFYGYENKAAEKVISKINDACIRAGESLDMNIGHFGDVALDFIVDQKGDIYFLEANSNYGHESLGKINNPELRERLFKSPLAYARALAGFGDRHEEG